MSQCGNLEFVSGGVITGSTIMDSHITNSTISNSTFTAGTIANLTSIDEASAKIVADAIAALSAEQLKALASALFAAISVTPAEFPVSSESDKIPTTMYGGRGALLGQPDIVLPTSDPNYVVPAYRI